MSEASQELSQKLRQSDVEDSEEMLLLHILNEILEIKELLNDKKDCPRMKFKYMFELYLLITGLFGCGIIAALILDNGVLGYISSFGYSSLLLFLVLAAYKDCWLNPIN